MADIRSIVEIWIEGYPVDITDNVNLLVTYNVSDIKDIASRKGSYSKTITLPGTSNNNKVFGFLFNPQVNSFVPTGSLNVNYNFDPRKKASATLLQDNQVILNGYIKLNKINYRNGQIEYDITFDTELNDFITILGDKKLEDLDLSYLNHTNTLYNITSSWYSNSATASRDSNFPANSDDNKVLYPVIDYGIVDSQAVYFNTEAMRPAVYAKHYWDAIFASASISGSTNLDGISFTYESSIIESDYFKRLIIPYNEEKFAPTGSDATIIGLSGSYTLLIHSGVSQGDGFSYYEAPFGTDISDPNSYYNNITYEYTAPSSSQYSVIPNITYNESHSLTSISSGLNSFRNGGYMEFKFIISKSNGEKFPLDATIYNTRGDLQGTVNPYSFNRTLVKPTQIWLNQGDKIKIMGRVVTDRLSSGIYYADTTSGNASVTGVARMTISSSSTIKISQNDINNTPINYKQFVLKNIKQKDYIISICKLFNLFIVPNKHNPKHFNIISRDEFYASYNIIRDWSYKIDKNSDYTIESIPELNTKNFLFTYKEDNDYYNTLYKNNWNEIYGQRLITSDYEFSNDTKDVLSDIIFSPTPLVLYNNADQAGESYITWNLSIFNEINFGSANISPVELKKAYPGVGLKLIINGTVYSGSIDTKISKYSGTVTPNINPPISGTFFYTYNNTKIIPAIYKSEDGNITRKPTKSNPRLLYYGSIVSCSQWYLDLTPSLLSNGFTYTPTPTISTLKLIQYPFVGHINSPNQPSFDLNFDTPKETYYSSTTNDFRHNLYTDYWTNTVDDTTDKDSKLVNAYFKLNSVDISNIQLNDIVYIDGTYYQINAIKDYQPDNNSLTEVELLKLPFRLTNSGSQTGLPGPDSLGFYYYTADWYDCSCNLVSSSRAVRKNTPGILNYFYAGEDGAKYKLISSVPPQVYTASLVEGGSSVCSEIPCNIGDFSCDFSTDFYIGTCDIPFTSSIGVVNVISQGFSAVLRVKVDGAEITGSSLPQYGIFSTAGTCVTSSNATIEVVAAYGTYGAVRLIDSNNNIQCQNRVIGGFGHTYTFTGVVINSNPVYIYMTTFLDKC